MHSPTARPTLSSQQLSLRKDGSAAARSPPSSWPEHSSPFASPSAAPRGRAAGGVLLTALMVCCWYGSALVAVTTAKLSVGTLKAPLVLCASQFFAATALTTTVLAVRHEPRPPKESREATVVTRWLALWYTLGFVFTNAALALASAPFVETVKAAEPISTVALAAALLGERESLGSYLSLLPVCAGVGMASMSGDSFNGGAFVLSLLANLGFSARAVLAKRLRSVQAGGGGGGDDVRLFFAVSVQGAMMLLPAAALVDGGTLLAAPAGFAWGAYVARLALNGLAYSVYNLLSFMVLSRVNVATHAVLNAVRRLLMIVFTSYYFGELRTTLNTVGVVVAVGGVCLYALAGAAARRRAQVVERSTPATNDEVLDRSV